MTDLLTKLQRSFVIEKTKDWNASDVELYKRAGGKAKTYATQRSCASEIRTNPNVEAELLGLCSDSMSAAVMTREQQLEDLTMIANASIDDVLTFTETDGELIDTDTGETLASPSIIKVKSMSEMTEEQKRLIKSVEQTKYGIKVTMHDSMTARKMLNEMQGFNAPTETHVTVAKSLDDFYGDA